MMKYASDRVRGVSVVLRRAFLLGAVAFSCLRAFGASESASLMTFSTEGPDSYADGTPVLDGEYYALVYQTAAAGDVRFTLSGEIASENGSGVSIGTNAAALLRALPRAKGGRCPNTTFSIETEDLPKLSGTGLLRLYLLDTRVYEDGVARVGGLESVQASVPVTATCQITTGASKGRLALSAPFTATDLEADVPPPRITGITVAGGTVTLTVEDTVDHVNYTADDPISETCSFKVSPTTGKTGKPVKLNIPQGGSPSAYYRIIRK